MGRASALIWFGLAMLIAVPATSAPMKLEGMGYQRARKVILGYGWKPVSANCYGINKKTCAQFPEIQSCSGVDPGYCGMIFARKDRCLYIGTSGGPPENLEEGDTHVTSVTFHAGPCFKG